MTRSERVRDVRARWRRATGTDSVEFAQDRIEMAAVAAQEEAHLMAVLDADLGILEQTARALAERRTGGGS